MPSIERIRRARSAAACLLPTYSTANGTNRWPIRNATRYVNVSPPAVICKTTSETSEKLHWPPSETVSEPDVQVMSLRAGSKTKRVVGSASTDTSNAAATTTSEITNQSTCPSVAYFRAAETSKTQAPTSNPSRIRTGRSVETSTPPLSFIPRRIAETRSLNKWVPGVVR